MENGFICKKNETSNKYDVGIYDTRGEFHKVGEYADEQRANNVARYMNGEVSPDGFPALIDTFRRWGAVNG